MKGCETTKGHIPRTESGFYRTYMSGQGLDVGYAGYVENPEPILPNAIGIDIGYPDYDGRTLPFPDASQDFVFAGHTLEHIVDYQAALKEWMRVVRTGAYLILVVPHQWLYEKKASLPSRYCEDHKRFYTPARLLREIEESLPFNSYRIVHMRDVDDHYNYANPPGQPFDWWSERFEIECVLKKIDKPSWELE